MVYTVENCPQETFVNVHIISDCESSMIGRCEMAFRFLNWIGNRTPSAKAILIGWDRKIQFLLCGEDPLFIEVTDGRLKRRAGETEKPDLVFTSDSTRFFQVMIGKMKFDQGFSSGAYTLRGSIVDAVKLMRIAELAEEAHPTLMNLMKTMSRLM
jgi:putative sterol carrier protein